MDTIDILLLGTGLVFGIYCFVAYRRKPTSEYRGYLIIATVYVIVYACMLFLLAVPGLGASQRHALRQFFLFLFALGVLLWLVLGVVNLYLDHWRKGR